MSAALTLSLADLPKELRQIAARLGTIDLRHALRTVALYLASQARKAFDQQASPDGVPWAKFKRPPSVKRGGPSSKLLRDTGILMGSLTGQAGGGHVEEITAGSLRWGTNVTGESGFPYGAAHQFGTRTIPARPFLGVTPAMIGRIKLIIMDAVKRAVKA